MCNQHKVIFIGYGTDLSTVSVENCTVSADKSLLNEECFNTLHKLKMFSDDRVTRILWVTTTLNSPSGMVIKS